ncbi:MAG: inosine-5-monophosphate dehydrogenase [Betaproteobacteria bacterium HGW-Betaproteobacteria-7]|jgi:CBS domain-containing protein|nr:MAG: inosine-5-monophosphate dehydrogenase [Betaproteobacteria bacterium HGW-Betaproteobacteria-7]
MPRRVINEVLAGRSLVTASKEMTVRAAARLMAEKRIGALVVIESGRIAGIFTERDALNKVLAAALDPDTTPVASVMVKDPQTIGADKPLAYALYMMAEGGFRHVPVVDASGAPIGMVSARDALGQDLIEFERELKHLEDLEGSIGY